MINTVNNHNIEKLLVTGNNRLKGTVYIHGAKNAALPILAATILSDKTIRLNNIPWIKDVAKNGSNT